MNLKQHHWKYLTVRQGFCPRMWRNSCTFPQQYAGAVIVCTPNCWQVVTHQQQQLISNHSNSSSNNTYNCNQAVITTVLSRFIIIFQSPLKQWLQTAATTDEYCIFNVNGKYTRFFPIHIVILCLHSTITIGAIISLVWSLVKECHRLLRQL